MKAKVFTVESVDNGVTTPKDPGALLQDQLNEWFKTLPKVPRIVNVAQSFTLKGGCVYILYTVIYE